MDKDQTDQYQAVHSVGLEIIVHATRVLVKLGIIATLYFGDSLYALPLTIWIIFSEALDQFLLYLSKRKANFAKLTPVLYVLNSVATISSIAYFADWITNDFYLIYLVHISSATLGYGFKTGFLSFILSTYIYSIFLYLNQAPLELYLRLPLFSIFTLRLFTSQFMYEKVNRFLTNVLSIEKSKQDFIGIASHNLRTPVAAIYGYIELLLRGDAGALSEEQSAYIKKIKGNNRELETLTEKLLQISIIEVGKEVNLFKQPAQIEVIIEDVVDKFIPVAKHKRLVLKFDKKPGLLPLVDVDVEKITAVLSNLLDNALKYTEKGHVTLTANLKDDFVVVSVKDTGIGISEEELPKIFNKFYRSGNILVYNQVGTGLGLYLGQKIVALHKGTINVKSNLGKGSTFELSIPVIKDEEI